MGGSPIGVWVRRAVVEDGRPPQTRILVGIGPAFGGEAINYAAVNYAAVYYAILPAPVDRRANPLLR